MNARKRPLAQTFVFARVRGQALGRLTVLVAVIVLALAACGSAVPTTPPSGTPGTSVPDILVAPTPEPAHSVRIATVTCPTSFALPGATIPPVPTNMTATLTPDIAALVTFYGNGTMMLLGPKDWSCTALVSADGSASMTITPPGQPVPAGSPSTDEQAVTGSSGGSCVRCIASLACSLFPEAWTLYGQPGLTCPTTLPAGELVTRPLPRAVVFEDPPGVVGTGEPSGGRYRALGLLVFNAGAAAGGTGPAGPSALRLTCTLPDAMAAICDELIEGPGET